jgi:hypothetical protein
VLTSLVNLVKWRFARNAPSVCFDRMITIFGWDVALQKNPWIAFS